MERTKPKSEFLLKRALIKDVKVSKEEIKIKKIKNLWDQGVESISKIHAFTSINKTFIKKIITRIEKYGTAQLHKTGPKSKVTSEILDWIEARFILDPSQTFKIVYEDMLDEF